MTRPAISRFRAASLLTVLFASHHIALACKCAPIRPACESIGTASVIFVGTVQDTGPTITALQAEFRSKLGAKEIEALENADELSLSDAKKIWARLLPKEALPTLRRVRTEEQLRQLTVRYFPVLEQWQRPVRFAVDETLKGEHVPIRTVWTGQGFGDCGFDFEPGQRYIVYAFRDDETARDETGICTRTRTFADASDDLAYFRGVRAGMDQPRIFGIATSDVDEFRTRTLWWAHGPAKFPVSGVRLKLEYNNVQRESVTDTAGRFDFSDLPPGQYLLTAVLAGFQFNGLPQKIEVKPSGCAATAIFAKRVGSNP